jgi:hypothetical protein
MSIKQTYQQYMKREREFPASAIVAKFYAWWVWADMCTFCQQWQEEKQRGVSLTGWTWQH